MPVATNANQGQSAQRASVPFLAGSWSYSEFMVSDSVTPGSTSQPFTHEITPGGFLRGLTMSVSSTSGVLGTTATLAGDIPWSLIQSMQLESIDGTPLLYPMDGYSYYLISRYCRPWEGDPANDPSYSATINPAFRIRFFIEGRITIGVLPNTDARAQYRMRYTTSPLVQGSNSAYGLVSVSTGVTAPSVTIDFYLETYAQPPTVDYAGNPIVQIPDGLTLQRFCSNQFDNTNTATNTIKENRVGNLIRNILLVQRSSAAVRTNLTSDPIIWRLDNTQLLSEYRDRRDYEAWRFGNQQSGNDNAARPTGVYPYFRYHNPGQMDGDYWLPTTEASYLQFQLQGGASSGTLQSITEDLAPAGPVPQYLYGL